MTSQRQERPRGLAPGGRSGDGERVFAVPGSKSLAQRAIVSAALCGGTTRIVGLPDGDDVRRALALVEACGARVERLAPAAVAISGNPPGPHRGWSPERPLDLGESGTLARLATAAIALCGRGGRSYELGASGTLLRRTSAPLFTALAASGVEIERASTADGELAAGAPASVPDGWPVRIRPLGPPPEIEIVEPRSSQEVSALALALSAYPGESVLHVIGDVPSRPYLEMTLAVLGDFAVRIERTGGGDAHSVGDPRPARETFVIRGPLSAPAAPLAIEPDASSAAVALAAACLGGGAIRIPGLTPRSRQGDVRIATYLAAFGCASGIDDTGLFAAGRPTRAVDLDLSGEPDLAPVLAIVAAAAAQTTGGTSRLTGLATLRGKESSRIEALATGLATVGFRAEAGADFLRIGPPRASLRGALLDPRDDHRIAFAFALLGLLVEGVLVAEPGCVAKSWPGFWRDLERAGLRTIGV